MDSTLRQERMELMTRNVYLVTHLRYGILVQAPNAGQAYEAAVGYGIPYSTSGSKVKVTRINQDQARSLLLNTIRSRHDGHH